MMEDTNIRIYTNDTNNTNGILIRIICIIRTICILVSYIYAAICRSSIY